MHIDLRYHHVKNLISQKLIELCRVGTKKQMEDLLTKPTKFALIDMFRRIQMHQSATASARPNQTQKQRSTPRVLTL